MTEDATLLQGKLALVTGSSSGAGVEIATALARRGARVAVHYRTSRAAAEMVARAIGDGGGEAAAFQADVARADDVRRLIEEVGERLGPISILVNNAGPFCDTPFTMLAEPDWDYVMDANLKSVYVAAQQVAPEMARLGWGRIVNVIGNDGIKPIYFELTPGAANAAGINFTLAIAEELAPYGITVNAVNPGPVDTERWWGLVRTMAHEKGISEDEASVRAIRSIPIGRLCTAEEVAHMVVFLASERASFVTGASIALDGAQRKAVMDV